MHRDDGLPHISAHIQRLGTGLAERGNRLHWLSGRLRSAQGNVVAGCTSTVAQSEWTDARDDSFCQMIITSKLTAIALNVADGYREKVAAAVKVLTPEQQRKRLSSPPGLLELVGYTLSPMTVLSGLSCNFLLASMQTGWVGTRLVR
eukprot:SAG31_NODE_2385_length_5819_cov_3.572902_4_plen_147_part_00